MTQRSTIFVIRLQSANLVIYTTLRHAYSHLVKITPLKDCAKYPSYETFNRRLREIGSVLELQTSIGTFTIEHHKLHLLTLL